jgi:hypothetical protein
MPLGKPMPETSSGTIPLRKFGRAFDVDFDPDSDVDFDFDREGHDFRGCGKTRDSCQGMPSGIP